MYQSRSWRARPEGAHRSPPRHRGEGSRASPGSRTGRRCLRTCGAGRASRPVRAREDRSPPSPSPTPPRAGSRGTRCSRCASPPSRTPRGLSWSGQWDSNQANPFSTNSERPESFAAHSYQRRRPAKCRCRAVSPGKLPITCGKRCSGWSMAWRRARISMLDSWRRARSTRDAVESQLSPRLYGGRSGGTSPSTRPMMKNGAPMTAGSGSHHHGGGTGTSVRAATVRIVSN